MHSYEVRPRKDRRGVDLISEALPFGRLWYEKVTHAVGYARFYSRSAGATKTKADSRRLANPFAFLVFCRRVPIELLYTLVGAKENNAESQRLRAKEEWNHVLANKLADIQYIGPTLAIVGDCLRLWLTVAGEHLRFCHADYWWPIFRVTGLCRSRSI